MPPRPIRTAALRHAGERTAVGAPPRRGGSVEIALPGTARLPPPAVLRRCLLNFFFRTPNYILNFRIAFWPLGPWTQPWTRDHKRACVNSNHTTPGPNTAASSRRRSPCAESATRARFAWPPAWRGIVNNCKSRHCNQRIGCCSPVRCIALRTAALLYCCTG